MFCGHGILERESFDVLKLGQHYDSMDGEERLEGTSDGKEYPHIVIVPL